MFGCGRATGPGSWFRRTSMLRSIPPPSRDWSPAVHGVFTVLAAVAAIGLMGVPGMPANVPTPAPQIAVDPSTAPAEVLTALPKLGPSMVDRIVESREDGPFGSLGD